MRLSQLKTGLRVRISFGGRPYVGTIAEVLGAGPWCAVRWDIQPFGLNTNQLCGDLETVTELDLGDLSTMKEGVES